VPNVIRLDDPTSHGGKVASVAATNFLVEGKPVACVGDKCICPIHGEGSIIEGESQHTINGTSVAYNGHQTSCGAKLISTIKNFNKSRWQYYLFLS